jgi:hypothetical protein
MENTTNESIELLKQLKERIQQLEKENRKLSLANFELCKEKCFSEQKIEELEELLKKANEDVRSWLHHFKDPWGLP